MEDPWSSAAFFPALCAALVAAGGFFSLFSHALRSSKKAVLSKESEAAGARRAARLRRTIAAFERPARSLAAAGFWGGALRAFAAALAGIGAARLAPEGSAFAAWILVALSALAIATAILAADHAARRAARHAPEQVAAALLPAISAFALPLAPLFFLARKVAALTRRVFPSRAEDEGITEDELRAALIEGEKSGIVESGEREMVEGVFYLGDRPLGAFMTHRSELRWLEADSGLACALEKALEQNAQACFPVADGSLDAIVGAAYREDIVLAAARDPGASLRSVMRKASFAPETMPALKAFKIFRPGETEALFVMDEYGGFAGMVSAWNLVGKIIGEFREEEAEEPDLREDGSWICGGSRSIDEIAEMLDLPGLSGAGDYHTLAGLVLSIAGELPAIGDSFEHRGYLFTVLDMEGNRINRVAIAKLGPRGL